VVTARMGDDSKVIKITLTDSIPTLQRYLAATEEDQERMKNQPDAVVRDLELCYNKCASSAHPSFGNIRYGLMGLNDLRRTGAPQMLLPNRAKADALYFACSHCTREGCGQGTPRFGRWDASKVTHGRKGCFVPVYL
jgi:hypothetical protein